MWYILILIAVILLYIILKTGLLWPSANGLRVLMYHHVLPDREDGLTVNITNFKKQIEWARDHHFQFITPDMLIRHLETGVPLHPKAVLFTFDDAYTDYIDYALPILNEYGIRSIVFVPTSFVGKTNEWDVIQEKILEVGQIRIAGNTDWGYHSHSHLNYRMAGIEAIQNDLNAMLGWSESQGITMFPAFAYPYGAYPKDKFEQTQYELKMTGIRLAFRIGNRINSLPLKKPYLIERLDIRGDESFRRFKFKMLYGKWT